MNKYNVKMAKKETVAEGTMAFYFERPAGFEYKAGQHIEMNLINPPETDAEGNNRPFSLASAQSENNLMIATRMRDTAFKRVLGNVASGTEVEIEGPLGSFTLHENGSRPAVFLIGGIGITPIRSILIDAAKNHLPHKLFLFYSNRKQVDAAFLEELKELEKENLNFKLVATMTAEAREAWQGETSYISKEMVVKYVPEMIGPVYYTSGPQGMVSAMRKVLNEAGVSNDDIKTEEFSGY